MPNTYIGKYVIYIIVFRMCDEHCRQSYPERGWIQFLILRILYENPMHGYRLLEELENRSFGCHRLEPGAIYTILRRMEARGLLKSAWKRNETGPDRRIYEVTEAGSDVLRDGLKTIVKRRALMDDLMAFYEKNFEKKEKGGGK
jgi:PadR family transcriptional regulator PadR